MKICLRRHQVLRKTPDPKWEAVRPLPTIARSPLLSKTTLRCANSRSRCWVISAKCDLEAEGGDTARLKLPAHPEICLLLNQVVTPHIKGKIGRRSERQGPDLKVIFKTDYAAS